MKKYKIKAKKFTARFELPTISSQQKFQFTRLFIIKFYVSSFLLFTFFYELKLNEIFLENEITTVCQKFDLIQSRESQVPYGTHIVVLGSANETIVAYSSCCSLP